jgi:hypothetical protein
MHMHPWRLLIIIALLLAGCGRSAATYKQAVANAVKSEPNVMAFEKLYPNSEHFISYFTGTHGTPRWNSKALIHGRYVLTMQFDVAIDSSGTQVTAASPAQFVLVEVSSVTTPPSGQTSVSYDGTSQRQFGVQEWKALEASGGDLSSLGIAVKRDQPVPNLGAHWKGA